MAHAHLPDYSIEAEFAATCKGAVCGVDEAGRGPWAGPVIAAAVVLNPRALPEGIDDSKRLNERRRERLYLEIMAASATGIGAASVTEIDALNILQASLLAMTRAVAALPLRPRHALIDGNRTPRLDCAATAIVKGDQRSLSIAAASIIAKVTRDRLMRALARRYPDYGWERNKGYGTESHQSGLAKTGPCRHHRLSFAPVLSYRLNMLS